MTTNFDLAERSQIRPLLAPADIVNAATATSYVDMAAYGSVMLLIHFGNVNPVDGVITMEQSSTDDSGGPEAGLGFYYRTTGVATDDTMGAITHVDSTGSLAYTAAGSDNLMYIVIPEQLDDGYRWCRAVITPTAGDSDSVTVVGVSAVLKDPRYPANKQIISS